MEAHISVRPDSYRQKEKGVGEGGGENMGGHEALAALLAAVENATFEVWSLPGERKLFACVCRAQRKLPKFDRATRPSTVWLCLIIWHCLIVFFTRLKRSSSLLPGHLCFPVLPYRLHTFITPPDGFPFSYHVHHTPLF